MQRLLLHWTLRFLRRDSQESKCIKGVLGKEMTVSRLSHVSSRRWVSRITFVVGPNDLFSTRSPSIPYRPLSWAHSVDRVSWDFFFRLRSSRQIYIHSLTLTHLNFFITSLFYIIHTLFHPNQTKPEVSVNQS